MWANFRRWKWVCFLSSLQLTVLGLLIMALLVIGGTILQAEKGIYVAQREIFQSWVFWLFRLIPLPGLLMIGALLFVNLLAALLLRLRFSWSGLGLVLVHVGLLVLLGGGFISSNHAREYFMTLGEGESSRMASAAREWELAVWTESGESRQVQAVDIAVLRPGRPWSVPGLGLELTVERFLANCRPLAGAAPGETVLEEAPANADPAENVPGAVLSLRGPQGRTERFSLQAGDEAPVVRRWSGRDVHFSLRLQRIILPLRLTLLDFTRTVHPGTDLPRSFTSRVEIEGDGLRREALIAMNRPLRFRGYTFYQSSYGEDAQGGASSTFAVVRNAGRWLPYVSSAMIFIGLLWHFAAQLISAKKNSLPEAKP